MPHAAMKMPRQYQQSPSPTQRLAPSVQGEEMRFPIAVPYQLTFLIGMTFELASARLPEPASAMRDQGIHVNRFSDAPTWDQHNLVYGQ